MSVDNVCRPRDAKVLIKHSMNCDQPLFIWGPPGIGKSEIIEGIAKEDGRPLIDLRLLLMEPTDIKGMPYYDPGTKSMRWAKPTELPGPEEVTLHNAILFLDELNAAPPSVQAAAYQLILNRRVGEYRLPDGVSIVAAGNRNTDKGVVYRMPSPLANRFVHIELATNFEDWQKWAINNGVHADVVGFLSHHKQNLFTFDNKSSDIAFATPRTWVFVSNLLTDSTLLESLETTLVKGSVGEGLGIAFNSHRKIAAKLPKPEHILTGKVKDLDIDEISAMYSLTISMCYTLKEWVNRAQSDAEPDYTMDQWNESIDHFFRYLMDCFKTEMIILGAKTALRDYQLPIDHRKLKNFKEFHSKYGSYILDD